MVFGDAKDHIQHFFDDLFVFSKDVESHITHLDSALKRLIDANLQCSAEKSKLFTPEVSVLGHIAGGGFIKPGLDKIGAIRDFPRPDTKTKVRLYLGLTFFFRKFVKDYALFSKPLTWLTKDDVPFQWGEAQQLAFQTLKENLLRSLILKSPGFART